MGIHAVAPGSKNKEQVPLPALQDGRAGSLNGVRVGVDEWAWQEGLLRWSAHPLGGTVCRDHAHYPAFAPGTSQVAVGLQPFCISSFIFYPT